MSRLVSPEGRGARMPRRLEPTEYEKRSCAGMGPRLRLLGIEERRRDPQFRLGDELSAAAAANDAAKVRELLEKGADPNHIHFEVCSDPPLLRTRNIEVVKILLAHPKIDVNVKSMNDGSVLHDMVLHQRDNADLVRLMLARRDLDVHASGPLLTAARFATVEVVRALLEHPELELSASCGLLHAAISRTDVGSEPLAAWLLSQEALDVNLRKVLGTRPHPPRFAHDGTTALMHCCQMDSITIEIGEREPAKRKGVAARQVKMMKMLLERRDLDLNAVDSKGFTALHWFCRAGRSDLVQLLLKDPRCLPSIWHHDENGQTPLEVATCELETARKPYEEKPYHESIANFKEVISLLNKTIKEKKAELEALCPAPLSKHPGTWGMAVQALG